MNAEFPKNPLPSSLEDNYVRRFEIDRPLTDLEKRMLKQAKELFPNKSEDEQSQVAYELVDRVLLEEKERDWQWGEEYDRLRKENPDLDEETLCDMVNERVYPKVVYDRLRKENPDLDEETLRDMVDKYLDQKVDDKKPK